MAVSRDGVAWVAYNSGEIFTASIETAHCEPTGYVARQEGFDKFGMAFMLDGVGATTEHLYLSGGPVDLSLPRRLARMEDNLELTVLGPVSADAEEKPELSGTKLGTLWGIFPAEHGFVEQIDPTSGAPVPGTRIPVYALDYVFAWAGAPWGGTLWMFLNVGNPYVYSVDLATGEIGDTYNEILPFVPIGAGVSTCVPVVIDRRPRLTHVGRVAAPDGVQFPDESNSPDRDSGWIAVVADEIDRREYPGPIPRR